MFRPIVSQKITTIGVELRLRKILEPNRFFQKFTFFRKLFFCKRRELARGRQKLSQKFARVRIDVNNKTTKGFCQIRKTLVTGKSQKNRQILLLRIFEGPKYHIFESISG